MGSMRAARRAAVQYAAPVARPGDASPLASPTSARDDHISNPLHSDLGGDHDANWAAEGGLAPDPTSSPVQPHVEIWAVPFAGGAPKLLAQGDAPVISPKSDRVAYESNGQVFILPIDGSAAGKRLFF